MYNPSQTTNHVPGAAIILVTTHQRLWSGSTFPEIRLAGKTIENRKKHNRERVFAQTQNIGPGQNPRSVALPKRIVGIN